MKNIHLLMSLGLVVWGIASAASAGNCLPGDCKPGCNNAVECVYRCRPVCKQETVKKDYFDVECEYICVPGIKFPWQKCCEPPTCGKVKRVHRLKKDSYECGTRTVWEWELTCQCRTIDCKACIGGAPASSCVPQN